jgi:hypothetical protein
MAGIYVSPLLNTLKAINAELANNAALLELLMQNSNRLVKAVFPKTIEGLDDGDQS